MSFQIIKKTFDRNVTKILFSNVIVYKILKEVGVERDFRHFKKAQLLTDTSP